MSERCAENGIVNVGATGPVSIQIMYIPDKKEDLQFKLSSPDERFTVND